VITGPTASGKTALSINLAKKIDAEIICADSRIVYKGLDIVSAKPTLDEMQNVPHHLIDIKEPLDEPYSAGDFSDDAKKCIDEIRAKNKPVIIQGGTWFYIKCLLDDSALPEIKADKKLREELNGLDNIALWEMLKNIDPKRAEEIHPNNKDRVIRAIEMVKSAGCEVSKAKRAKNPYSNALWFSNEFIDDTKREELYKRINKRVDLMADMGLYDEWERMKSKFGKTKVLANTIGYREFFELEDGKISTFSEAVEKIKQRTRNFAKRQYTFFKQQKNITKVKNEDEICEIIY